MSYFKVSLRGDPVGLTATELVSEFFRTQTLRRPLDPIPLNDVLKQPAGETAQDGPLSLLSSQLHVVIVVNYSFIAFFTSQQRTRHASLHFSTHVEARSPPNNH